jgi:hypothetical protein
MLLLFGASLAALVSLVLFTGGGTRASEPGARPLMPPRPIVDTHDLMHLFNKPVYEFLKEAMQQEPADEQGWRTVQERGLQVAEVMNLVALRADSEKVPQWTQLAASVQQKGQQIADAGRRQNWRAATRAYQGVIEGCNNCHQRVAPEKAPVLQP